MAKLSSKQLNNLKYLAHMGIDYMLHLKSYGQPGMNVEKAERLLYEAMTIIEAELKNG